MSLYYSKNEKFNGLISHIKKNQDLWLNFLNSENPENQIPDGWQNNQIQ